MMRKTLSLMAIALASSLPAQAQEATLWTEAFFKMADTNRDGMMTRQEYLDHMARMWDKKHAGMMKSDAMMKPGMMDKPQFMAYAKGLLDPGQIGGN
jgi:hypothetical protein